MGRVEARRVREASASIEKLEPLDDGRGVSKAPARLAAAATILACMGDADSSFSDLGRPGDSRPVKLVNEYYRPQGDAVRAERVETQWGPLLVGLDDAGELLWTVPWGQITQAQPPASPGGY